jgi:predicted phage terminase large subunit-like protein
VANDTELKISLLKWQGKVLPDPARFKVICAGRRVGKTSYSLSELLLKSVEPEKVDVGTAVMFIAPTNKMAMDLAWDQFSFLARPLIVKAHVNDQDFLLSNGMTVKIRGSDKPDSLRGGKLYHVILDEYQDIKPQTWEYAVQPALTDLRGTATFIGTPKPDAEEFRRIYDLGNSDNALWKSWHFTTYDNELISRDEIQMAKETKSIASFEQEYMASWDTTGANILRLEWFKAGQAPEGEYSTFITIDPAGYEHVADNDRKKHLDFFAIAVVRVYDDGKWWVQKIDYGRWDVREAAVRVLMAVRTHKPMMCGIEKGSLSRAIMPYLNDLMRKNNVFMHIEQIATSGNSKVNRITYALQGLMEHGRIIFNERENWDEVKREMLAFPSERAHDDLIDALSMIPYVATVTYAKRGSYEEPEEWAPLDDIAGI